MPNYCPQCGSALKHGDAKFCMECGFNLQTSNVEKVSEENPIPKSINIYDLGEKMEDAVEQIFLAKGYETKRRQRIKGKSDTINEIDILAYKKNRKIAIECKNHTIPIGQGPIREFMEKLRQISIPNGYFITNSDFTKGATKFAQYNNIILWSGDQIRDEFWQVHTGRAEEGIERHIKNALPVQIGYEKVVDLDLINKEKIQITSSNLLYKPYYVIEYLFKDKYVDPSKETHNFIDEGLVLVDGLDGKILNKIDYMGKIRNIISNSDEEVDLKIKDELQHYKKTDNYRVFPEHFNVSVMEPQVQNRYVHKLVIDYITEKNTRKISYLPKSAETSFDTKIATYVPKSNKIMIKKVNFLYVPKWKIEYQSSDYEYSKELYAYSGTKIEDTIEYCPNHLQIGGLRLSSKKTHAVCEVCGKALCNEHIYKCPTCGKWLCAECGAICSSCNRVLCQEHIHNQCSVSRQSICDDCTVTCPICGNAYGKKHEVKCSQCGTIVCKNCSQSKGLIIKKQICNNCL